MPNFAALAASGTLNRDPQAVRDPLFRGGGFFDPRDLLQLRYEMIRRHRIEKPVGSGYGRAVQCVTANRLSGSRGV